MSDFDDAYGLNEDRVEMVTAANLTMALSRRKQIPAHTGFCVWCEEPALPNSAFCCPECRIEYEHNQRIQTIKGKR